MRKLVLAALLIVGAGWMAAPAHAQSIVRNCNQVVNGIGNYSCPDSYVPNAQTSLLATVASVKSNAAGLLGMVQCYNPNASAAFVQIFDAATAGSVTLGTTPPTLSIGIPATTSSGPIMMSPIGIEFRNGIQVAATTTATGNTAPGSGLSCNFGFD